MNCCGNHSNKHESHNMNEEKADSDQKGKGWLVWIMAIILLVLLMFSILG